MTLLTSLSRAVHARRMGRKMARVLACGAVFFTVACGISWEIFDFGAMAQPEAAGSAQPAPRVAVPTESEVDWAAVRDALDGGRIRLAEPSEVYAPAVDDAELPVLIPARMEGDVARVSARRILYLCAGQIDGHRTEVSGSRLVRRPPEGAPLARNLEAIREASPDGMIVTQGDDLSEVSFSLFGVAYTISIFCEGSSDAVCTDEGALRDVARDLVLLNEPPAG